MTTMAWLFFEWMMTLFESVLFICFILKTCSYKRELCPKWIPSCVFGGLLFGVVTLLNSVTVFEGVAVFIYALLLFLFTFFFFTGPLVKKIVLSIIPIICVVLGSASAASFMSFFFRCSLMDLLSQSDFYRFFYVLLGNIFFVIMLYVAQSFFAKHEVSLAKTEWLIMGVLLSVSVIIMVCLYFIAMVASSQTVNILVAVVELFLIAIDISAYYLLIQLSKKHTILLENTLLKQQCDSYSKTSMLMKEQYGELQKIRHDFDNTLCVIRELNGLGKKREVEDYIAGYLRSTASGLVYITTENEYINAIVNLKLAQSKKRNIRVTTDIMSSIEFPDMIDLCNIIGNLFDNAIEACERCGDSKSIQFSLTQRDSCVQLFMKNTILESVLQTNPELKTIKDNQQSHGYGTKIIRQIAEKYHGFADFYEEGLHFCCNVILYSDVGA